jgi:DNA-binding CsgD family transcriptional regulator/PAS domain-containing protein
MNKAYMLLHRWGDPGEIIGKYIYEVLPEAITKEGLEDIMQYGENTDMVVWRYRKGGFDFNLSVGWSLIKDGGQTVGAVIVVSDITRETNAMNAERMVRNMYKSVCEDQSEIIIRVLATGHIVFINEAASRYFHTTQSQLYGTKIAPRSFERLMAASVDAESRGDRSILYDERSDRYIEYISRLSRDERGDPFMYTVVGRDATDFVKAMQQMSQLLYGMVTVRERQVLDRLLRGMTRKEIAHDLQISTNTYDTLIARIKRRWGTKDINNIVELISKYQPNNVATNMW